MGSIGLVQSWLFVFLGWGLGELSVALEADVDVHLGIPEGRCDVYAVAGVVTIHVLVCIPLESFNLIIAQIVVIILFNDPSTVLIHVFLDFFSCMFIAHVGGSFLVGLGELENTGIFLSEFFKNSFSEFSKLINSD